VFKKNGLIGKFADQTGIKVIGQLSEVTKANGNFCISELAVFLFKKNFFICIWN